MQYNNKQLTTSEDEKKISERLCNMLNKGQILSYWSKMSCLLNI